MKLRFVPDISNPHPGVARGPRQLGGASCDATAALVAVLVTTPMLKSRAKVRSSVARRDGIVKGSTTKPGQKIAASQVRKSRHAGSKKAAAVAPLWAGNAHSTANTASMPVTLAGNRMPRCRSNLRRMICRARSTMAGAMASLVATRETHVRIDGSFEAG